MNSLLKARKFSEMLLEFRMVGEQNQTDDMLQVVSCRSVAELLRTLLVRIGTWTSGHFEEDHSTQLGRSVR